MNARSCGHNDALYRLLGRIQSLVGALQQLAYGLFRAVGYGLLLGIRGRVRMLAPLAKRRRLGTRR